MQRKAASDSLACNKYSRKRKITLLVLRHQTIIFVVEPSIHLLLHHPLDDSAWQDISEHGAKSSVEHHVPRVAIFRDPAHDPGTMSGADKHLANRQEYG